MKKIILLLFLTPILYSMRDHKCNKSHHVCLDTYKAFLLMQVNDIDLTIDHGNNPNRYMFVHNDQIVLLVYKDTKGNYALFRKILTVLFLNKLKANNEYTQDNILNARVYSDRKIKTPLYIFDEQEKQVGFTELLATIPCHEKEILIPQYLPYLDDKSNSHTQEIE